MRSLKGISLVFTLLFVLLPWNLMAQGTDPPPPCCRKFVVTDDGLQAAQPLERQVSAETVARLSVSDDIMRRAGLTRREMVDRFAAGFFGLKNVDLLIPITDLLDPGTLYPERERRSTDRGAILEKVLVAIQVRRFYQVPISMARSEDIDSVDQLFITDGEIYLTVDFSQ